LRLDDLVRELDAYFRVPDARGDSDFDYYPEPYWREFAAPGYEGRWNGLMVRGAEDVERAATCVFPTDRIVAGLEPRTLLFSEHPVDLVDEPGFVPLARASFERMRELGIAFYHVHGPLDQHPEISPSRLIAGALGLTGIEEYFPIVEGIPGGAAVVGDSDLSVDALVERLGAFLGPEIPIQVLGRRGEEAGRVAVVGGGGGDRGILEESIARGARTYVTGQVVTRCRLDFVQEEIRAFRALADEAGVTVVDGTHYGTEKPPQLAMVEWFRARGLEAEFVPDGPH
jgi:putative NIF3 family GTP cyclohydrolase 1 type 2